MGTSRSKTAMEGWSLRSWLWGCSCAMLSLYSLRYLQSNNAIVHKCYACTPDSAPKPVSVALRLELLNSVSACSSSISRSRLLFCFPPSFVCLFLFLLLMYSSSNSFLGGASSARPGQPPFAQQPQYSPFPSNQQQSHLQPGFAPQPTGYPPQSGPQLQPQPTGLPGAQLQPQFTGFPGGPPQQHQQQQTPPQQSFQPPPQQPQFTSYAPQNQPPQSQPPQLQVPATTGLPSRPGPKTSSEIADSFRGGSAGPPEPPPKSSASSKIPSIRLSFITAQDQAKFEQLFKSAVGDNQAMDGQSVLPFCGGLHSADS